MTLRLAIVSLLGAFIFQTLAPSPIRIGDAARQLSGEAMAELERGFLSIGGKPWLILGFERLPTREIRVFGLEGYLPAETTSASVRRGRVINASHRSGQIINFSAPTADRGGRYAQVAVPGRSFDTVQGDRDINHPFLIIGEIDDTDLVRIVTLIRSSPTLAPPDGRVLGDRPIRSITRRMDGSVEVHFRRIDDNDGQGVMLSRQDSGWIVTRTFVYLN